MLFTGVIRVIPLVEMCLEFRELVLRITVMWVHWLCACLVTLQLPLVSTYTLG